MIDAGLSRGVINRRVGRVVRLFKWAVAEELVPEATHRALATVSGLQAGRTEARESRRVGPVPWAAVEATLPHLSPMVRAMVLLQWYTGARPGEVRCARTRDVDRSGAVWLYTPASHKTERHGHRRVIAVGPKAQAVLRPLLMPEEPDRLIFSPAAAVRMSRAERRARRKTKVPPSQADRRKPSPRRRPGEVYTKAAYAGAVYRGCRKARVEPWHPHQLRHAFATQANRRFGVEEVQTALGHATLSATQIYAEKSVAKATEIALAIG
jgi:integrase